ncbi:TetR/AcrR family transcriptional regulator C-terminal domain-containing protein [Microbacterium aurantiacum]|uniref:TetR/AcrR family transcriptional regulator C-terminal domain-containing protein n=1 Tax=Microbacterium aurantiacum TaxID=162393 RepID=UPI000C7F7CB7|nr:TetR/AcrR family transcriptional regulator C-terminal domain-containing protein [Microbacterium aurantiacum]
MAAALRIMDAEGEPALTFARLGEELKASPTAVYRHFAGRHDVLKALADHLDGLSIEGYEPTDEWRIDLENLAWRAWRTANAHPAAAATSFPLVTNGLNELRAVEWVLRAIHMAGLRGPEAVIQYQVYSNLVLGSASAQGARLSAPDSGEAEEGWVQVYAPKNPAQFPYAEAAKSQLALVNAEEVFAKQVEMYLDALAIRESRR